MQGSVVVTPFPSIKKSNKIRKGRGEHAKRGRSTSMANHTTYSRYWRGKSHPRRQTVRPKWGAGLPTKPHTQRRKGFEKLSHLLESETDLIPQLTPRVLKKFKLAPSTSYKEHALSHLWEKRVTHSAKLPQKEMLLSRHYLEMRLARLSSSPAVAQRLLWWNKQGCLHQFQTLGWNGAHSCPFQPIAQADEGHSMVPLEENSTGEERVLRR